MVTEKSEFCVDRTTNKQTNPRCDRKKNKRKYGDRTASRYSPIAKECPTDVKIKINDVTKQLTDCIS